MALHESELRARARTLLKGGQLPCVAQDRTWGGAGAGLVCSLCDTPIDAGEVEYELEFIISETLTAHRFHGACLAVWELARREDC